MRSSIDPGDSSALQPHIQRAGIDDATRIATLINAAFVVERVAFDGDRIDLEGVQLLLSKGSFLIVESAAASASLAAGTRSAAYTSSHAATLLPRPALRRTDMQGRGIGRQLASRSRRVRARKPAVAPSICASSAPEPHALLPLYTRLGYVETGT